jgi:hypothetical protein
MVDARRVDFFLRVEVVCDFLSRFETLSESQQHPPEIFLARFKHQRNRPELCTGYQPNDFWLSEV